MWADEADDFYSYTKNPVMFVDQQDGSECIDNQSSTVNTEGCVWYCFPVLQSKIGLVIDYLKF